MHTSRRQHPPQALSTWFAFQSLGPSCLGAVGLHFASFSPPLFFFYHLYFSLYSSLGQCANETVPWKMTTLAGQPVGKRLKSVFFFLCPPVQVDIGLLQLLEGTTLTFELLGMLF